MEAKIIAIGNLGGDPEMRYMPDGTAVTNFSMACNRRYTDRASGDTVEEVTWLRISVWGRHAEVANQYLRKGRQVYIEGRLRPDPNTGGPRLWTAHDGTVRASFEVTAHTFQMLGSRDSGSGDYGDDDPLPREDDEIPF